MSSMSQMLGEIFTKTASPVEENNEAYEFFGTLCKQAGVDPSQLNDEQLQALFAESETLRKQAADEAAAHEKEETAKEEQVEEKAKEEAEKKAAAALQEYEEKRAAAVKVAEAEAMGRIMAHAFMDELRKTAAEEGMAEAKEEAAEEKKEETAEKKQDKKEASAVSIFQKKASEVAGSSTANFDELAAHQAIDLLKQAGCDADLAYNRINAAYTLGLQESTKIAHAVNAEAALTVRALEFCEAAGFPVDWSKV